MKIGDRKLKMNEKFGFSFFNVVSIRKSNYFDCKNSVSFLYNYKIVYLNFSVIL